MSACTKKKALAFLVMGICWQGTFAEDVNLRFSWWGGGERHEATIKAIKEYESKNPGIKIKAEYSAFEGYAEKLAIQLSGGTEADIIQTDWAWLRQFSKDGAQFYDIKKTGSIHLDEFINEAWKTGMINGKLNGVPTSYTAQVFIYNKSTWDKAGIPFPKTWDGLLAAGKTFEQKLGKDYFPLDGGLSDSILIAMAYMYQKTGKPWIYSNQATVAYTEAEALEWVQFYKRMVSDHVIPSLQYRVSSGGGNRDIPAQLLADWVNGKFAGGYIWDSTFKTRLSTPSKTMVFDVAGLPQLQNAKSTGYTGRPAQMFVISKNSKNPEAAAKFVNWMVNSKEAANILGAVRGVSMSTPFREVQIQSNKFTPQEVKAMKLIESVKIDPPSPFTEYPRVKTWLADIFEKVAMGKISDTEAAKMLVVDTNAMLRRVK